MKTPARIAAELVLVKEDSSADYPFVLWIAGRAKSSYRSRGSANREAAVVRQFMAAAIDADRTQRASVPGGISAERLREIDSTLDSAHDDFPAMKAIIDAGESMDVDDESASRAYEMMRDQRRHIDYLETILHLFHDEEAAAYAHGYDAGKRAGWREAKAACVKAAQGELEGGGSLTVAEWNAVSRTIEAVEAVSDEPREG